MLPTLLDGYQPEQNGRTRTQDLAPGSYRGVRPDWAKLSALRERYGSREDRPAFVILAGECGDEPFIGLCRWHAGGHVLSLIPQEHEACGTVTPIISIDYPELEIGRVEWLAYSRCIDDGCLSVLAPGTPRLCPTCEARAARVATFDDDRRAA